MRITDTLFIDENEIEERAMRASGPGGQHVNKTESAVQLRFDLNANQTLPAEVKARLRRLAGSRLTKEGEILIRSENHRSRERNREAARERLRALIERATHKPKPRKKTRPSLSSIRKNKAAKAKRSETKSLRKKPASED